MLQGNILKHSIGSYNLVFFFPFPSVETRDTCRETVQLEEEETELATRLINPTNFKFTNTYNFNIYF